MTRRYPIVLVLTGLVLAGLLDLDIAPSIAFAQPSGPQRDSAQKAPAPAERAGSLAGQGQDAYERGDYREAIALYGQAYELEPDPGYLYEIGISYSYLGDIYEAAGYLRRYLDANPPDRQRVEQARLLESRHTQEIKVRADYEAKLTAARRVVEGLQDKNKELEAALERADKDRRPPPMPPPPKPAGRRMRIIGAGLMLTGGAVLGMGIAYGLVAGRAESELGDLMPEQDSWNQSLFDLGQDADRNLIILSIAGVGFLGAGVTLYTLGERQDRVQTAERAAAATLAPVLGPSYAGIQAAGSF